MVIAVSKAGYRDSRWTMSDHCKLCRSNFTARSMLEFHWQWLGGGGGGVRGGCVLAVDDFCSKIQLQIRISHNMLEPGTFIH